jgi:hypothetical protein
MAILGSIVALFLLLYGQNLIEASKPLYLLIWALLPFRRLVLLKRILPMGLAIISSPPVYFG